MRRPRIDLAKGAPPPILSTRSASSSLAAVLRSDVRGRYIVVILTRLRRCVTLSHRHAEGHAGDNAVPSEHGRQVTRPSSPGFAEA
jgi:hypothetical protein